MSASPTPSLQHEAKPTSPEPVILAVTPYAVAEHENSAFVEQVAAKNQQKQFTEATTTATPATSDPEAAQTFMPPQSHDGANISPFHQDSSVAAASLSCS